MLSCFTCKNVSRFPGVFFCLHYVYNNSSLWLKCTKSKQVMWNVMTTEIYHNSKLCMNEGKPAAFIPVKLAGG